MVAFEVIGLGTQRYDLYTSYDKPDALVYLRTRRNELEQIQPFAEELAQKLQSSIPAAEGKWACVRMQVIGDQTAEACSIILNSTPSDVTACNAAASTLETYRAVLRRHRDRDPQPPISHDLTLLPSGQRVQYQGSD